MTEKFRNIEELRKDYKVIACFTTDLKSRIFADIVKKGAEDATVDACIVMINPGSCNCVGTEVNDTYAVGNEKYKVFLCKSDPAQKCIMQLMDHCKFSKVRILNLSDIREPNSMIAIGKMKGMDLSKSIFSDKRKEELQQLMPDDAVCIIAWGLDKSLFELKKQAIDSLVGHKLLGICENEEYLSYRYIKPYKVEDQKKIISELTKLLKYEG